MGSVGLFSPDGEYFTYCSPDGCLKIWDVSSDRLKQEYTPSSHLASSSTCIAWGPSSRNSAPPRKKAKKSKYHEIVTTVSELNLIAMGTLSGDVLLYSVTKGDLHLHLRSGHSDVVNDVCWHVNSDSIFTCSRDQHIVRWKISSGKVYEKWKADKHAIHSICVVDEKNIISASSSIKWWDLETKTLLKKFNGHGTEVFRLLPINQSMENSGGRYFVSAAVGDRTVSAWRLKEDGDRSAVASFTLPEDPCSVYVTNASTKDQPVRLSVITRSGSLHIFEHQLNGRCKTPLLPKVTFHIATSNAAYEKFQSVPVLAAQISSSGESCQMAYGNFLKPVFETIELQDCDKDTHLIRDVLIKHTPSLEKGVSMVKEPNKDAVIKHLAPGFMTPSQPTEVPHRRRKQRLPKEKEFPMEERLNALILDKDHKDEQRTAKADSVAHLLLQGLQSQDHNLLSTALQCSSEAISNSVLRLPLSSIPLLLKELHKRLHKQEQRNHPCLRWMKSLLTTHLPYLITCQDIDEYLGPLSQLLEARVKTFPKLMQVKSNLEALLTQVSLHQEANLSHTHAEALVTYREDSSDSEERMSASEPEESIDTGSEKDDTDPEDIDTCESDSSGV